jgi:hypothetical protein
MNIIPRIKSKISSIDLTVSNEYNPRVILLAFAILLSIVIAIIPHLLSANVMVQEVGVDTSYYIQWVKALGNSKDLSEFIKQAFVIQSNGDRPLVLIFIYLIWAISNIDLFQIIEYLPIILAPCLVFLLLPTFLVKRLHWMKGLLYWLL